MMRWLLAVLALSSLSFAQEEMAFKATVVGADLQWELEGYEVWLVPQGKEGRISLYSPGLDPEDYRSALKGEEELGDERYDRGQGSVQTVYQLYQGSTLLREATFGVEPHREVVFFEGPVGSEPLRLRIRMSGLGKNTFLLKLKGFTPYLDGQIQILDVRYGESPTIRQPQDQRGQFVELFRLEVPQDLIPSRVGFYDEDGPEELLSRVVEPDGKAIDRSVSKDRAWAEYVARLPGLYRFLFAQPPMAKQYSNTIVIRTDACIQLSDGFLRAVPPGVRQALVVDPQGNPLPFTPRVNQQGLVLLDLPQGYRILEVRREGAVAPVGERFRIGCPGGRVTYVVEPPKAGLLLEVHLDLPTGRRPGEAYVTVGQETRRVVGQASYQLPPGSYPIKAQAEGASVEGPREVYLPPGGHERVTLLIRPQVDLVLSPAAQRHAEGEKARITLKATTLYPGLLPGELALEIPRDLEPLGPTRVTGPLSKDRPLELTVEVKGPAGIYMARGQLQPYGLSRLGEVEFYRSATFALKKETLTPKVAQGEVARFRLTVINEGDEKGTVRLRDLGGMGLEGEGLDQTLTLDPRQGKSYEVGFRVTGEGPLVNRAELLSPEGQVLARKEAFVEVLLPRPALDREVAHRRYLPGEGVTHRLRVRNLGQAPMPYTLEDTCPDFLEPREARFEGLLLPGEEWVHTYTAKVRFGPEAEGSCQAILTTSRGTLKAEASLARVLLSLKKEALPERVLEGSPATFLLTVTNPADHPVRIRLLDTPPKGLPMEGLALDLPLEANETRTFNLEVKAVPEGVHLNRASAFLGETPVAFPAEARLAGLPLLVPERLSEIRLPYQVKASQGEGLLVALPLPEGAEYIPGSARLSGLPLEDPLVYEKDGKATLYWRLPFAQEGEVRFSLRHERALPPLPKAGLTLLAGGREVALDGKATLAEYREANPLTLRRKGVIREPGEGQVFRERDAITVILEAPLGPLTLRVNGKEVGKERLGRAELDEGRGWQRLEFYGVPLVVGKNLLQVEGVAQDQVEVFRTGNPVQLRLSLLEGKADGRTPIRVRVEALDENGLPAGFGPVTVESSLEPLNPDAFLEISGYQLLLKNGRAELLLKPLPAPREFTVRAEFNRIEARSSFFAGEGEGSLWLAQGSVGVALKDLGSGLSLETLRLFGLARAYAEGPVLSGRGQLALDTAGGLSQKPSLERFPVTGTSGEAKAPLTSDDPIAFRYDQPEFTLSYEGGPLGASQISATALRFSTRGSTRLEGFVGLLPRQVIRERITPDGTSYYRLREPPRPGSLTLILVEGSRETRLSQGKDYVVDDLGNIQLSKPLFPTTIDLAPVFLLAEYAPLSAPRDLLAYGFGASYEERGLRFGVSTLYLGSWRYSLEAGYNQGADRLALSAGYADGRLELALGADARVGAFRLKGDLRTEDLAQGVTGIQGGARLAYEGSPLGVALEHTTPSQTALLLEYRPTPFTVGAGLGYLWGEGAWAFLGRAGYEEGGTQALLTHTQTFGLSKALSRLDATLPLDPNLFLEAGLLYAWGEGLSGTLSLRQRLAGANLALSYELPTASGEGNRARFGVEAPLPLTDSLSLNLSLGLERNLFTGQGLTAFGLAARYQSKTFSATLGGEVSLGQEAKVALKGGATGSLDQENTVAADFLYTPLEGKGRFSLAYALFGRDLNLLTYHRFLAGADPLLEGELALAYHQPAFQARPGFAYRVKPQDPAANTYQFSLGGNLYLSRSFGLGGALYYLLQPGTRQHRLVYSVEGSLRVLEDLWFNLGYSFGETLLQPEGLYLRLDFFGGSR